MQGSDLPEAIPIDADTVVAHWVDYVVGLILDKKDCVTIVDGTPGEGKSTFTLWFSLLVRKALNEALGVDVEFSVERDVVYRLSGLIHRIYQSSRATPSVVLADEGVLVGAQARAGSYDASIILDRVLSVSRIHGVTLFLLAPSIWGLAASVRDRRARLWFHVERRGLSTAFILKDIIPFKRPQELPFKKARQPWAKVHWESMDADPIWGPYERQKIDVTKQTLVDSELEALKIEKKAGMATPGWASGLDRKVGSGRAPNETPVEYHRRMSRESMRQRRAETARQQISGALSSDSPPGRPEAGG